jgi:flagellar biosynthesis GTPase FlhF
MQKITITATTLNDALQEVKRRFGEDVVIERTEEINNEIRITVTLFDGDEPILVPSLRTNEKNRIDNPLSAIRLVEEICQDHYLGSDFKDFWLKCLSPYLTLTGIDIAESLSECLNFEPQWIRKILSLKPVVFLGSFGVGKTQILAKVAALLKASERAVEIYNLDTLKASRQGLLQAYAHKLDVPYYFGKEAWGTLQASIKNQSEAVKLIDTSGVNFKNPEDLSWLASYAQKFVFDPVLIVPCDGCVSLASDYASFIKKFGVRHLILSKTDVAGSWSLPVRLAWVSEVPIAMVNGSANLSENLQYLNAGKLLNSLNKAGYQLSPENG